MTLYRHTRRRVTVTVGLCLLFQLMASSSTHAWWEWLDRMSGPGRFTGWSIEVRLVCFVEPVTPDVAEARTAEADAAFDAANSATTQTERLWRDAARAQKEAADMWDDLAGRWKFLKPDGTPETGASDARRLQDDARGLQRSVTGIDGWRSTAGSWKAAVVALRAAALRNAEPRKDVKFVAANAGVFFTACSIKPGEERRASINFGIRNLSFTDDAPSNAFGGGRKMKLITAMPTFSWRLFSSPRYPWLDVVDLSTGAGVYWFSSEANDAEGGFRSFPGTILQPLRANFHIPPRLSRTWGLWATVVPGLQYGWVAFPGGFEERAFGPQLTGEKAARIPGEFVSGGVVYWDLEPLSRWLSSR